MPNMESQRNRGSDRFWNIVGLSGILLMAGAEASMIRVRQNVCSALESGGDVSALGIERMPFRADDNLSNMRSECSVGSGIDPSLECAAAAVRKAVSNGISVPVSAEEEATMVSEKCPSE